MPNFQRPREKIAEKGPGALKKEELLAILLRTGSHQKSALQIAKDIIRHYPEKHLAEAGYKELKNIHGMGNAKVAQIMAALELGRRFFDNHKGNEETFLKTSQDVAQACENIRDNKKENCVLLCLDARRRLIYRETLSIGTINASLIHPREVFAPALQCRAAAIMLAHNHPSGNPEPSREDLKLTQNLVRAGKLLGITVLDHVIIATSGHYSLQESNLL